MVFVQLLLVGITQCWRLLCGVLSSIYSTKASHAQLPDMSLRRDTQALHLIAIFLLFSGEKSAIFVKKKAPSCSGFPPSMYVVLKTRYVNPISTYVDIRSTYIVQTYQPLVHNFYPYVEQQPNIALFTKLYRNPSKAI